MLFRQSDKKDSDEGLRKLPPREARLNSIPAIARGRRFTGTFSVGTANYEFSYAPARVSVVGRRLQFQGRLTVKGPRGHTSARDHVRATLVGTQGGIGAAPTRPGNPAGGAPASSDLPQVESTGATSFCGVMYLHFEPLVGNAFGVPADISRLQLNVRFAPLDDDERAMHAVYSSIVNAIYGAPPDATAAASAVKELNAILARS